jgi:predicted phage-related endonuclease
MCKANDSIITKVSDLMELRKMIEDLQTEAEALTDEIKAYMGEEETMMAGTWKVTYKETVSRRMDTTALKKVLGDALEGYYKTVVTRPFKVI